MASKNTNTSTRELSFKARQAMLGKDGSVMMLDCKPATVYGFLHTCNAGRQVTFCKGSGWDVDFFGEPIAIMEHNRMYYAFSPKTGVKIEIEKYGVGGADSLQDLITELVVAYMNDPDHKRDELYSELANEQEVKIFNDFVEKVLATESKASKASKANKDASKDKKVPAKDFIGTTIDLGTWQISFDGKRNKTVVQFTGDPTGEQDWEPESEIVNAVEMAGFWRTKSEYPEYTKKLTFKAYRAALALADEIREIQKEIAGRPPKVKERKMELASGDELMTFDGIGDLPWE